MLLSNNFIYNFGEFKYSYSLCMSILGILILFVELYSYWYNKWFLNMKEHGLAFCYSIDWCRVCRVNSMIRQNIIINSIELSICWFLLHCNTILGWVMAFREPPNPPKPGRISLKLQEGTNLRYSFSSIEGRSTPLTTTTQYALPSRWLWNIVRLLL